MKAAMQSVCNEAAETLTSERNKFGDVSLCALRTQSQGITRAIGDIERQIASLMEKQSRLIATQAQLEELIEELAS